MSKQHQVSLSAHPNIYNNYSLREFNLYFSEPEHGVNEDTGLLLLIPGFGGNASSNVYKKMRSQFADEYNLVTIQCDYFGQEFMQAGSSVELNISKETLTTIFDSSEVQEIYGDGFNPNKLLQIGSKYNIQIKAKEKLLESQANFNDMGIMQALDNITAVSYVIAILTNNQLKFNANKIILYGHSHGAFLCYLCNAFAPGMFSLLIDNSSWLFPAYLQGSRHLFNQLGNMIIDIEFDYLASHMPYDKEMLYLPVLYSKFMNQCEIECFHGTTDNLISHIDKKKFSDQVDHCFFHEISSDRIDNHIFKSTNHGLDADFLKLFDYVMSQKVFEQSSELKSLSPVVLETSSGKYHIDYDSGVPLLSLM